MALTIRMRIDENDEHSYYYATGDGTEIELIPLVVDANGVFVPDENKAYNRVTVNVPETELESLIVTTNNTYTAPSGKAYNVVEVNVQPILEAVSRTYSSNGTYSITPSSGKDGISSVSVVVNVPSGSPNLQDKTEYYYENGNYAIEADTGYDGLGQVLVEVDVPEMKLETLSETILTNGQHNFLPSSGYDGFDAVGIYVDVPTGGGDIFATEFTPTGGAEYINLSKGVMPTAIYVVTKDFTTIMNGGGRYQALQYAIAVDPQTSGYYLKMYCYKGSTNSTTSQSASSSRTNMMQSVPTNNSATMLVYDSANDRIGYYGKAYNDTSTSYGFANGCKYQLFAIY